MIDHSNITILQLDDEMECYVRMRPGQLSQYLLGFVLRKYNLSRIKNNDSLLKFDCNSSLQENFTDLLDQQERLFHTMMLLYTWAVPLLIVLCIVCIVFNMILVMSICWIRKPLSPTLYISISLAGADMYTLFLLGTGLVINSYLPLVFDYIISHECVFITVEALRLGGILITMLHLLFLALNHYLGILRPLHYPSIMTHRHITLLIIVMWTLPNIFMLSIFSIVPDQLFQNCSNWKFMKTNSFHSKFSYTLLTCLVIMSVIYSHIYVIVKRHQANRNKYKTGSYKHRRSTLQIQNGTDKMTIHSSHHNSKDSESTKNEKAIYTTFLIVGSVVIGWMPGAISYYLVCDDCFFTNADLGGPLESFIIHCTIQALVILKSGVNSYIYAARMHEIKNAVRRMYQYYKIRFCPNSRTRAGHLFGSDQHLYFSEYQRNRPGGTTVSMYSRSTITRTKKPNAKRKSSDVQAPLTAAATNGASQSYETGDTSCL
uniref:5-hydroxytryptamine receptor 7 n=1 Tax=Cacopsylla melanoneura TaxID=428564 RepID=A0A8D8QJX9_9HEMI